MLGASFLAFKNNLIEIWPCALLGNQFEKRRDKCKKECATGGGCDHWGGGRENTRGSAAAAQRIYLTWPTIILMGGPAVRLPPPSLCDPRAGGRKKIIRD